jgi:hypothetical protein
MHQRVRAQVAPPQCAYCARLRIFKSLLSVSRNISILAHIVNPNLGVPSVKAYLAYVRKIKRERADSAGVNANQEE